MFLRVLFWCVLLVRVSSRPVLRLGALGVRFRVLRVRFRVLGLCLCVLRVMPGGRRRASRGTAGTTSRVPGVTRRRRMFRCRLRLGLCVNDPAVGRGRSGDGQDPGVPRLQQDRREEGRRDERGSERNRDTGRGGQSVAVGQPSSRFSPFERPWFRTKSAMRMRGLEPPRGRPHTDLNRARLPIPPHPRGPAL